MVCPFALSILADLERHDILSPDHAYRYQLHLAIFKVIAVMKSVLVVKARNHFRSNWPR